VFGHHTGDEVRAEVATERTQCVGVFEVGLFEHGFVVGVAHDNLEAHLADALGGRRVLLYQKHVVTAIPERTRRSQPDSTGSDDDESHTLPYITCSG